MSKKTGVCYTDGDFFNYMRNEERKILEEFHSPEEVERLLAEDEEDGEEDEEE